MATLSISPHLPISAFPMTSGTSKTDRLRGQERQIALPEIALGGFDSGFGMVVEEHLPLVQSYLPTTVPSSGSTLIRLFRDISAAEASAGITLYRGFFVYNNSSVALSAVTVYTSGPVSGTVTLAAETPTTTNGKQWVQRVTNETTAPTGPTFGAATSGSPLSLGDIAVGEAAFLWVKLVLGAGATAAMYDLITLNFADSLSNTLKVHNYHTVQKGLSAVGVSGLLDGQVVPHPWGDTYTLTITDSAGSAIDPPTSTVMVYAAGTLTNDNEQFSAYGNRNSYSLVGQANKTATGIYKFQFRPPSPGHWYLTFDLGGEMQTSLNVEVSPVP